LSAALTPSLFRERFALATFADGGVVVDLVTGSYARMNPSAAALLSILRDARETASAIETAASRFGISPARARADLEALSLALEREGTRIPPIEPFRYRPAADGGYDLWHGERRALHVDATATRLVLACPPETLSFPLFEYVSDMAPKLVFLMGTPVLHGSAWLGAGGALGLCGKSRAGKTTTARALARQGGVLVSEDLIVLARDLARPAVYEGAEKKVHAWAREVAAALTDAPGTAADLRALQAAATGPTVPLSALWFLDARRRGDAFTLAPLSKTGALVELMSHTFLGAAGEAQWRRFLDAGRSIVDAAAAFEAALPLGLDRLDGAMGDYAMNSAS
jgi:hypothetical protein